MRGSHHGLVAKSGRLARGRIHLCKPLCVKSKPALAKTERTIHFPRRCPSTQGYPGSGSPPDASASRSPAQAPSTVSPGRSATRHTPCASGNTSAPRSPLPCTPAPSSAVRYRDFDLPQQAHHLLGLVPLTSSHLALLIPVSLLVTGTKQAAQTIIDSHFVLAGRYQHLVAIR